MTVTDLSIVGDALYRPEGGRVERDALLSHLRGWLAPHKLPRIVMRVDTIGRAPNGKADYRALAGRVAGWHAGRKE